MITEITPILTFLTSFMASIFLLPKLAHIAGKIGLVDQPNARKVHKTAKPLVGGLGIVISVVLTSLFFLPLADLQGFFAGLTVLTVTGFLDDFKELGHKSKFAAQIVAVALLAYYNNILLVTFGDLLSLGNIVVPAYWLSFVITIFCTVGVVNALNMIDGLDGLAGGLSFIAFISFAVIAAIDHHNAPMLLSLTCAGAILGFLRYNWRPAKLFMGDAGSMTIGFSLAYMALSTTQEPGSLARPATALLILAVPIADTLTIMTKRLLTGKNPFKADNHHLHHILLRYGFSKKMAVKIILVLSAILATTGIVGSVYGVADYFMFLAFMIFFGFYFTASFLIQDFMRISMRVRRKREWYGHNLLSSSLKTILRILDTFGVVRKNDRQPVKLSFTCSDKLDKSGKKTFNGTIADLSTSGFMAWLPEMKFVRDIMKVKINIPTDDEVFTLEAIAEDLWISEVENTCCYHGFKFIAMDDAKARILKDYLTHLAHTPTVPFSLTTPQTEAAQKEAPAAANG